MLDNKSRQNRNINRMLSEKIASYESEILASLSDLVSIASVKGEAEKIEGVYMPFGHNVHQALLFMKELAEKESFPFTNVDNYGGHLDYRLTGDVQGKDQETLGILVHLDVVPQGSDWDMDPFGGEIIGDKIYGRGVLDNKGAAIIVFYALKALKDLSYRPAKNIRMVFGLDEETGWSGMDYYLDKVRPPDFGFTPDAEFPVIKGEKGVLIFDIVKKLSKTVGMDKGLELKSIRAGNAANMVPDYARALIFHKDGGDIYKLITEEAEFFSQKKDQAIKVKASGKSLEVLAQGISAHGAKPESGYNAISLLMEFLGGLSFKEDDVNDFIAFYNKHIGFDLGGQGLGISFKDEESGNTIVNVGVCYLDQKEARITVNVRYPVSYKDEEIYQKLMETLAPYSIGIIKKGLHHPIYFTDNDPLVKTLMEVYQDVTGDLESEALVIGGGTYARAMKNFLAFGPSMPGDREVAHKKNEYMEIKKLMEAAVIYGEAIYRLTKD